ncbi:hypothetical protein PRIPAC_79433 [Pristionchus pacificus]|uniref:Uncharacterized protein n=1 Tax=Pristionchus pacificus TaxID=54126 RepID=A0A2A6BDS4_PRIPA|nr:hypothetical protein PRIPAC_79433 [Pristionchus pacificus]|eukprot:PDM64032.1 hypothetical protein PRIPAC_54276 [Pristionchus pacificus]
MKILWCIKIDESYTRICTLRLRNRPLSIIGSLLQLIVANAALAQHALSIYLHRDIFLCRSNIDESKADWSTIFLAYDIIIFDFGLMRRVLGTEECVANYLDGGYMRSLWCLQQSGALLLAILCLFFSPRTIWLLWPALLIQSSYSLGLSVLTMATAPKLLDALSGIVDSSLATRFILYFSGFAFNWLFTFILWHHYWELERRNKENGSRDGDEQVE